MAGGRGGAEGTGWWWGPPAHRKLGFLSQELKHENIVALYDFQVRLREAVVLVGRESTRLAGPGGLRPRPATRWRPPRRWWTSVLCWGQGLGHPHLACCAQRPDRDPRDPVLSPLCVLSELPPSQAV